MANIYEGADSGMFSAAPPTAPMPGALARRVRGRLGGQAHLGQLAKLHPNHPIFRKFPGLATLIHLQGQRVPPPEPGVQPPAPVPPGPTPQENSQPSYMQNIPQDMSGYGAWGAPADPAQQDPMAAAQSSLRDRLMDRFHTAQPQQPALTSRQALRKHIHQGARGRTAQRRQPLLPLRDQFRHRPY